MTPMTPLAIDRRDARDHISARFLRAHRQARTRTRLQVRSSSMAPLLLPGDEVDIDGACLHLAVGDLFAFEAGGMVKVHRAVARRPGYYLEKGDNSLAMRWIPADDVLGRVVSVNGQARAGQGALPDRGYAHLARACANAYAGVDLALRPLGSLHAARLFGDALYQLLLRVPRLLLAPRRPLPPSR